MGCLGIFLASGCYGKITDILKVPRTEKVLEHLVYEVCFFMPLEQGLANYDLGPVIVYLES